MNPNLELNQLKSNTVENTVNLKFAENEIESESNDGLHGLNDRKKYQKLSLDQVCYIKTIYESISLTKKEFQSKFNISSSVLNKIKRRPWNQINSIKRRKIVKIYDKNREDLINIIKEYVFNSKNILTAKEIVDHANNILNTTYSASFIRTIMKKEMMLSFRRIKSRPSNIDFDKIS